MDRSCSAVTVSAAANANIDIVNLENVAKKTKTNTRISFSFEYKCERLARCSWRSTEMVFSPITFLLEKRKKNHRIVHSPNIVIQIYRRKIHSHCCFKSIIFCRCSFCCHFFRSPSHSVDRKNIGLSSRQWRCAAANEEGDGYRANNGTRKECAEEINRD